MIVYSYRLKTIINYKLFNTEWLSATLFFYSILFGTYQMKKQKERG